MYVKEKKFVTTFKTKFEGVKSLLKQVKLKHYNHENLDDALLYSQIIFIQTFTNTISSSVNFESFCFVCVCVFTL